MIHIWILKVTFEEVFKMKGAVLPSSVGAMTYSVVMHISNLFSSEFAHSHPLSTSSERSNSFTVTSHFGRKKKKQHPWNPVTLRGLDFASVAHRLSCVE